MAFNVVKDKHGDIKKAQYYVWYLGWKECHGLAGREFTEPIVKDLVIRRRRDDLPKLTIEVGKKEIKIFQQVKGKWGKTEKIRFPTVPSKDLTYATQGLTPDEDVVACVFLGFNPTTRRSVHVHVYRCDSPDTAEVFVDHLSEIFKLPEHQERLQYIERDLVERGEVKARPRNFNQTYQGDGMSTVAPSTVHTDDVGSISSSDSEADSDSESNAIEKEKEQKMEVLAREFSSKLKMKTPILLPPTDYDTVRRGHGDLKEVKKRKSLHRDIIGYASVPEEDQAKGGSESRIHKNSIGQGETIQEDPSSPQPMNGEVERRKSRSTSSKESGDYPITKEPEKPQPEADIQVVSPRWKTESVFVPPKSAVSSSPPLAPGYASSHSTSSPMVSPSVMYQGMNPPLSPPHYAGPSRPRSKSPVSRRHNSPHASGMGGAPYQSKLRSPSPGRRDPMYREPTAAGPQSPRHRSRESGRSSSPRYADEGRYGPYQNPPVVDDRIYGRTPDEGYRSLDRADGQDQVVAYPNGRKLEKSSRKEKNSKKEKKQKNIFGQKSNPGDDLPIDYTVGRSASFKYAAH